MDAGVGGREGSSLSLTYLRRESLMTLTFIMTSSNQVLKSQCLMRERYICARQSLFIGLDHWTGLLDWNTGLIFDMSRCQRSPKNCGPPGLSTAPYLVPPGQTLETNPAIQTLARSLTLPYKPLRLTLLTIHIQNPAPGPSHTWRGPCTVAMDSPGGTAYRGENQWVFFFG